MYLLPPTYVDHVPTLHNYIPTPHISTQKTIARFYSNIVREIRAELEYFRVGFYGAGFPPFLKVRTPVLV